MHSCAAEFCSFVGEANVRIGAGKEKILKRDSSSSASWALVDGRGLVHEADVPIFVFVQEELAGVEVNESGRQAYIFNEKNFRRQMLLWSTTTTGPGTYSPSDAPSVP